MMRVAIVLLLAALLGQASAAETDLVSLAFVGDVMLAESIGPQIARGHDPLAPFSKELDQADLRIANLECVVSDKGQADPEKPYTFRANPRVIKLLKQHFDALGLANNHSGDFGPEAFGDMLNRLEQAGIPYFGGGRDMRAAHQPLIVERKGVRIALLGYDEFFPRWFEADEGKPGIAWSEDELVQYDIRNARENFHADIVIPVMHWGWEQEPLASARQHRLAHLMIDAGADAVVGAHPHVIEDIEIYQNKPIVYSLGNFVFDGFSDEANNTGWLLRLLVNKQGVRGMQTVVAHIDAHGTPHPGKANDAVWMGAQH